MPVVGLCLRLEIPLYIAGLFSTVIFLLLLAQRWLSGDDAYFNDDDESENDAGDQEGEPPGGLLHVDPASDAQLCRRIAVVLERLAGSAQRCGGVAARAALLSRDAAVRAYIRLRDLCLTLRAC